MNSVGYVHSKIMSDESLSISAKAIYTLFKLFIDENNVCCISVADMADSLLMSKPKIKESIEELMKAGIIIQKKTMSVYRYTVRTEDEKETFGKVFLSVILSADINYQSKVVYSYLCSISGVNGYCFPKQTYIAKKLGISRQLISGYTTTLEQKNLVIKDRLYKDTRQNLKYIMVDFKAESDLIFAQISEKNKREVDSLLDIGYSTQLDIGCGPDVDTYNNNFFNNNIGIITRRRSARDISVLEDQVSATASTLENRVVAYATPMIPESFANAQDSRIMLKPLADKILVLENLENKNLNIKFSNKTRRPVNKSKPTKTTMMFERLLNPTEPLTWLKLDYYRFNNESLSQDVRFDIVHKFCGNLLASQKTTGVYKLTLHKLLRSIAIKMTELSADYPNIKNWCFRVPKKDYARILSTYEDDKGFMSLKRARELVKGLLSLFALCSVTGVDFDSSVWLSALNTKGKSLILSSRNSVALALELTLIGRKAFEERYKDISEKQKKWFEPDEKGNYYL